MTYRVCSLHGEVPLPSLDVRTSSFKVMAEDARGRAHDYGTWEAVCVHTEGERPLRGDELKKWIDRHA